MASNSIREKVNNSLDKYQRDISNLNNARSVKKMNLNNLPADFSSEKMHYGPPNVQEKIDKSIENRKEIARQEIDKITEDLPQRKRDRERQYAEDVMDGKKKIEKEEQNQDRYRSGETSKGFNDVAPPENNTSLTQQQIGDQVKENFAPDSPSSKEIKEGISASETQKDERDLRQSQFVSDRSQTDVEPSLYEQYVKERQDNPLTEPEHDLEQETDYDRYVREREKYPTTEHESDLYNQYLEEREQHDTSKEPEKGQDQQKEHELDER